MGLSEVIVEKFSRQKAKTESVEEAELRSFFGVEAGKNAAWALLIMWALHRHTIYDLPLIGKTFQDVS